VGDRTRHPLIQHVPVAPLDPEQLADLGLCGDEASVRASLARCAVQIPRLTVAGRPAHGHPPAGTPQQSAARSPVSRSSRPAVAQ
jgi:hypothetical protein